MSLLPSIQNLSMQNLAWFVQVCGPYIILRLCGVGLKDSSPYQLLGALVLGTVLAAILLQIDKYVPRRTGDIVRVPMSEIDPRILRLSQELSLSPPNTEFLELEFQTAH